eukprot:TRINITY_DN419_c0_g2_i4.p2 TRINITY_DN419_c0_g2~~TRINITY_DN419_c0_g2_i4.p2  ORF type:complete len:383 (-),score=154.56 TRINITY_DN419_c0_g2_i4:432-1580(-)
MSLSSDNSISNNSNSGSSNSSAVAAFLAAATRGDLPTMRTLAEADPRLSNAHDDEGRTALYLAAARGHGAAAAWLTAEGGARWLPLVGFGSQAPRPSNNGSVSTRIERGRQQMRRALNISNGRETRASVLASRNMALARKAEAAAEANRQHQAAAEAEAASVPATPAGTAAASSSSTSSPLRVTMRPPRPTNWAILRNAPRASVKSVGGGRAAAAAAASRGFGKRAARRGQRERAPRVLKIEQSVCVGSSASAYTSTLDRVTAEVAASLLGERPTGNDDDDDDDEDDDERNDNDNDNDNHHQQRDGTSNSGGGMMVDAGGDSNDSSNNNDNEAGDDSDNEAVAALAGALAGGDTDGDWAVVGPADAESPSMVDGEWEVIGAS